MILIAAQWFFEHPSGLPVLLSVSLDIPLLLEGTGFLKQYAEKNAIEVRTV